MFPTCVHVITFVEKEVIDHTHEIRVPFAAAAAAAVATLGEEGRKKHGRRKERTKGEEREDEGRRRREEGGRSMNDSLSLFLQKEAHFPPLLFLISSQERKRESKM